MAIEGKTSSKIFVGAIFGLILSIKVPACYLRKVKNFYTNASFVQKKYPNLKLENRQNDRTGMSSVKLQHFMHFLVLLHFSYYCYILPHLT